jgi:(R,R)-butanediol dehydrogenase / meso-butanediol dehydrogenase / diacetyl reductase
MMGVMRAAVYHGAGDVRVSDMPDPRAGAREVVVKVTTAGVCGSDVNRFRHGSHPWAPGFIMGHEFCGEIVEAGPEAAGWRAGDQVIVQPTLRCGMCFYCRHGQENRCAEFTRRGLTGSGTDGGFADYVRVAAYQPHRRPLNLAPQLAALVEPTAVSVHGWNLAGVERPDSVVVVGLGNIGLLAILAARVKGAGTIVAVGKYAPRQALARTYGADLVLEPDDARIEKIVLEHTGGLGAALVFEAAGTPASLRTAVATARKGGKVVVLGVIREEAALDYREIVLSEKQILGSIIYQHRDFAEAIDVVARGRIDVARHITTTIPLEDIVPLGFQPLVAKPERHIKIQVDPRR